MGILGPVVSAAPDENIENKAVLIDGSPEPMLFVSNGEDDFVEVPLVPEPSGRVLI